MNRLAFSIVGMRMNAQIPGGVIGMAERDRVQLLLWRAGFGATPAQVDAATALGYAQVVENMLALAGGAPAGPALPTLPALLPPDATEEQIMARKQAIKEVDQIGLTA